MYLYPIILFITAFVMFVLSFLIYKGKTNLVHDYHQTRVKDKAAYGKAMGKALAVLSAGILLSGIVALAGESDTVMLVSVAVLIAGMFAGFVCIYRVQMKYNGGVFME